MTFEKARFLLVNGTHDHYWTCVLAQALEPLGHVQIVAECEAPGLLRERAYDLIIIDTSGVEQAPRLIACIRAEQPGARIVVMTASPTWTRAREAFLAGAIDYTRKSLDHDEIRSVVRSALDKPVPSRSE